MQIRLGDWLNSSGRIRRTSFTARRRSTKSLLWESPTTRKFFRCAPQHRLASVYRCCSTHYLLLQGTQHSISGYHASLSHDVHGEGDPVPIFKSFCLERRDSIEKFISTRYVGVSGVRRGSYLLLAFGMVAEKGRGYPLALIELGAVAGLALIWDR